MKRFKRPFRVNEAFVRGVALEVFFLALIAIVTKSYIPILIMTLDFGIRVFLVPQLSYLAFISRKIVVPMVKFKKRQIMFKPKRFAASMGFTMTLLSLLCYFLQWEIALYSVLSILILFSGLEAFFKFCAGCKIFSLLIKVGLAEVDFCTDCYFEGGEGI